MQNLARGPGARSDFSVPDFQQHRTLATSQEREGSRPGRQAAYSVPQRASRQIPIQTPVLFFDLGSVARAFGGLWAGLNPAGGVIADGPDKQAGAHVSKTVM